MRAILKTLPAEQTALSKDAVELTGGVSTSIRASAHCPVDYFHHLPGKELQDFAGMWRSATYPCIRPYLSGCRKHSESMEESDPVEIKSSLRSCMPGTGEWSCPSLSTQAKQFSLPGIQQGLYQ